MKSSFKNWLATAFALVALTITAQAQTASDNYLDIANYETIDESGWNTSRIDKIYKYTANSTVAWVTMSVYGTVYGEGTQNWLEYSNRNYVSVANTGGSWSSDSPFLGSIAYFSTTTARAFGYSTSQNQNERIVSYYVTNTTAVRLKGSNHNNYENKPTYMSIYECTKNADGSLTVGTSQVNSRTENTSKNSSFNLTYGNLDKNKIYKVKCSTIYGYFYEIAFCTPLPQYVDVTIGSAGITTFYHEKALTIPYEDYYGKLESVGYAYSITDKPKEGRPNNKELHLVKLESDIPAKTGVVIMGEPGTYQFPINRGAVTPLAYDNLLRGYLVNTPRANALSDFGDGIVMTLGRNPNSTGTPEYGFYKFTGATLAANKAFLIYVPTAGSNVSFISFGGNESDSPLDGIRDIKANGTDDAWYTLQGTRLSGQPTAQGIYIHGGRTVAVK